MAEDKKPATIFSIGGGKGGVGKSIFSIATGVILARRGHSVVLADLDLGAANLHTYLGIRGRIPTIADFILRKVPSLKDILVETSQRNMLLLSGAEYVSGVTNPAHWIKMKLIRHLRSLPVDFVIIDLGAGVHLNILDFFGISNRGIVVTTPEPGAVMNAYSFIKGAFYRRLQNIFRNHPEIGPLIESETKKTGQENRFTLEWLSGKVKELSPELYPLIEEIEREFRPALVINRTPEGHTHLLVKNLMSLCSERLGITIEYSGNIPDVKEISHYLLNIPKFFDTTAGQAYFLSAEKIIERLNSSTTMEPPIPAIKKDFTDEELEEISGLIEGLDDSVFNGTSRDIWKLRLYFKPLEVVNFLVSRGVTPDLFMIKGKE